MEFLIAVIAAAVGPIALHLLSSEIYDKLNPLGRQLLKMAVLFLPIEMRAEREEEWVAHFIEREGNISKLRHAISCIKAALVLRDDFEKFSKTPFAEKSLSYRAITRLCFVLDCAIAASAFFLAIPHLLVILLLYLYDLLFSTNSVEKFEDFFLRTYYNRLEDLAHPAASINKHDIFYTPEKDRE